MVSDRKFTLLACCAIIVLGVLVYANSIGGEFIWDDGALIRDNIYLRSLSGLPRLFTSDWGAGSGIKYTFYRPLTSATFFINYSLGNQNVEYYHVVNVLLHILVALCIYWFVIFLFGDRLLSLMASVLFTVFPTHTETVSYISGRVDSLPMVFMLLSFIFYVKRCDKKSAVSLVASVLFFILALLSKENALIFPVLLFLYHLLFKRRVVKKVFSIFLVIPILYILFRHLFLRAPFSGMPSLTGVLQRIPGFFAAISGYFRILLLPLNLHMDYGDRLFSLADPRVLSGYIIACSLLFLAFTQRKRNIVISFGIFWFFIALIPVSNLYPVAFYMADHYLYFPSLGFFLVIAKLLSTLYHRNNFKKMSVFIFAALTATYSVLTAKQNSYWRDPTAFYERTLQYNPDSWRALHDFAFASSQIDKRENALTLYRKSIMAKPDLLASYNDIALLYRDMGQQERAQRWAKKVIGLNPAFTEGHNTLALIYSDMGRENDAIMAYEKAISIDPGYEKTYNNLAWVYRTRGESDTAIELYKKAIGINPFYKEGYFNLGNIYSELGRPRDAILAYEKAVEIDPRYKEALNNLGAEYVSLGESEKAITAFQKVVEIDRVNGDAHNNLAVLYFYSGKLDLAKHHLNRAIELGSKVHPDFLKQLKN